jgi:uncharacterized protein (TIGR02145 family)
VAFKIDTAWKDDAGIPWNPRVSYGSLFDARDGQTYRTVVIGNQSWMAENLNIYRESYFNWKFGSHYSWERIMDGYKSSSATPSGVRGICPIGWHIPSRAEWDTLIAIGDSTTESGSGITYKSTIGWTASNGINGVDVMGFRLLPAGIRESSESYNNVDMDGNWWTATEDPNQKFSAYSPMLKSFRKVVWVLSFEKTWGMSLRCLED